MARKDAIVSAAVFNDGEGMEWTFYDGTKTRLRRTEIHDQNQELAFWHGLKQKTCDAAAISRDPETGKSADPELKKAKVLAMIERMQDADGWNQRGTGEGGAMADLLTALLELYPEKGADKLGAYYSGLSDEQKKTMMALDHVAPVVARIRAERAARKLTAEERDKAAADLIDDIANL